MGVWKEHKAECFWFSQDHGAAPLYWGQAAWYASGDHKGCPAMQATLAVVNTTDLFNWIGGEATDLWRINPFVFYKVLKTRW